MLHSGDFSAWITVDEAELPQYSVQQSPETKQITCWISSIADKKFTVCWRDPVGAVCTGGYLTVDGQPCGAKHLYQVGHSYARNGPRIEVMRKSSVATSATTERRLRFANLELTDDDSYLDVPTSAELGDIKLELYEVKVQGRGQFHPMATPPSNTEKIHERSKKAVGHRIKFGDEVSCREKQFITIVKIRHIVTFIFRYRPLSLLQANGIVAQDPTPVDRPRKRGRPSAANNSSAVLDLTIDDDDRTLKRVKAEVKTEVKSEVKSESEPWPRTLGMRQLGDVIDLT